MERLTPYSHTQRSPWAYLVLIPSAAVLTTAVVAGDAAVRAVGLVAGVLVAAALLNFGTLNVTVDESEVRVAFGAGWPRRLLAMETVTAAVPVRNRWYFGWGLRKIPGGWLWNVWGLDAVELMLDSGKVFRIGTDDQEGLATAIELRR